MIPAQLLHRLLVNLVDSASSIDIEQADRSDAAHREELESFAGTHDLDLEDTATLFRVAAGEAFAPSQPDGPAYRGIVTSGLLGRSVSFPPGPAPADGTPVLVFVRQAGQ